MRTRLSHQTSHRPLIGKENANGTYLYFSFLGFWKISRFRLNPCWRQWLSDTIFLGSIHWSPNKISLLFPSWKMTKKRLYTCSFPRERDNEIYKTGAGAFRLKGKAPPLWNFPVFVADLFLFPIWTETVLNSMSLWSQCTRFAALFQTRNSL